MSNEYTDAEAQAALRKVGKILKILRGEDAPTACHILCSAMASIIVQDAPEILHNSIVSTMQTRLAEDVDKVKLGKRKSLQ